MVREASGDGSVVVALDGSAAAEAAAVAAIRIARARKWPVRGLYVIDEPLLLDPYADHETELGHEQISQSREELVVQFERRGEELLAWLAERCRAAGVSVTGETVLGKVAQSVIEKADGGVLLALGRRGHGHPDEPTQLGSNFRSIAHSVSCPFLAGGAPPGELRRLLVAYDGGKRSRDALLWASRLQETLSAEVVVLTVPGSETEPSEEFREARAQLQAEDLSRYRFLTREGEPVEAITAAAAANHADCILLGGYRHTAAVEWLVGSTVDGVLRRCALPVVVA